MLNKIKAYDSSYSVKKIMLHIFLAIIAIIGIGSVLGLTIVQIILLVIIFLLFVPKIIVNIYTEIYEEKKFIDVSNYLEQMLYSFRRKSKIISALEDTSLLFSGGSMERTIEKTLEHISVLETEGDFYKEAFSIIEHEYNCDIMNRVHEFMTRVESNGGEYVESADILISDRNRWVTRVLEKQKEKKLIKRNVTLGIILSLIVIVGTVLMVPTNLVDNKTNIVSQISSWITLVCNFILWIFVQSKLSGSWIASENNISEKKLEEIYRNVVFPKRGNQAVKSILSIVTLVITGYFSWNQKSAWWLFLGVIVIAILLSNSQRVYEINKKKLKREVEKAFPDWMMSLSLLLQTENIQGAIQKSIRYAPTILQVELKIMQEKIEQQPTSIDPYLEFYEVLNLNEIQSSMRMLYSMSQSGGEEMSKQINALIERNVELEDQSERLKIADYLAGVSFCVLIPMLIGCGKMLVDMALLMYSLIHTSQAFF